MKVNEITKVEKRTTMVPSTKDDRSKPEDTLLPVFLAKDDKKLSIQDYVTAYEMTTKALSEYYKGVWNNAECDSDIYFENKNLKQYTTKKIADQYNVFHEHNLTNSVETNIESETDKVQFVDDTNQYIFKIKGSY